MTHVIVHNAVSADGRVAGFDIDVGLHYEIAATFDADIHLAGSDTILDAGLAADPPAGTGEAAPPPGDDAEDTGARLVVVDSRGRVRCWQALRQAPHWRDAMVAIGARATPAEHVDHLATYGVDHIIAGETRVDLAQALGELERRYGARRVLVDSGGTLNAALLRAGLVDEVSLLVHPCIAGADGDLSMVRGGTPAGVPLRLLTMEQRAGGIAWLRYAVTGGA